MGRPARGQQAWPSSNSQVTYQGTDRSSVSLYNTYGRTSCASTLTAALPLCARLSALRFAPTLRNRQFTVTTLLSIHNAQTHILHISVSSTYAIMAFFGFRKYPTPVLKPMYPFLIGGAVTFYLVASAQRAMLQGEEQPT